MEKKRHIIYFALILLIIAACDKYDTGVNQSETFIKYYGGNSSDYASDVKQLPDGGYFIVGTISMGENNTDVFTLITDEYGNSKADLKTYGGPFKDKISRMQLLPGGGAVAIGTYQKTLTNSDIWVLLFNSKGDTLWTRKFGTINNDEGYGLLVNAENEIICTGYTNIQRVGFIDKQIWMFALNSDGTNSWQEPRVRGAEKEDEGNNIIEVEDGYIIVGTTNSYPVGTISRNILLLKTDKKGTTWFPTPIGTNNDDYGKMVKQLPDGSLIVLGTTINTSSGNSDILLVKLEPSFNILWTVILNDGENETANSFIVDNDRIHILGTTFDPRTDTKKMLLITTNSEGTNPVYRKFGYSKEKIEGFGMDNTSDGGLILTGSSLMLYKLKDLNNF